MSGPSEPSTSILSILSLVLNSELLRGLVTEIVQWWRASRFRGAYKVDQYDTTLELLDKHGETAIFTKRQHVEFLQDGIVAIQDQAWGDGDIFVYYHCAPGVEVDRYIESYRWKILISLRATRNRGDREKFVIERSIKNGFTAPTEHFQTQIDHPTQLLNMTLIFPSSRLPKRVILMQQDAKRSLELPRDLGTPLSNGRVCYQWSVTKPRLYEAYILKWEW